MAAAGASADVFLRRPPGQRSKNDKNDNSGKNSGKKYKKAGH
ncbi:MAG: hypothetical protein O9353_02105 [Bacteroidia bacterium]|nr:hypothetical protein [Polaromonas sp.]MCZ8284224.1 hypothetical protein [Bacteroidia bacterium]